MTHKLIKTDNYLLVVDDSEIKAGKIFLSKENIIHTNIGWNYGDRVIISHLPLNDSPILEGVDFLPPLENDDEAVALSNYLSEYPTEFETVYEYPVITDDDYFLKEEKGTPRPKTITTAQGVQWVGKYK